jgi:diacylglycerol kinase family enzyme
MENVHVFIYCNPTSGGNKARKLLELPGGVNAFDYEVSDLECRVHVKVFDLKTASSREEGFQALKAMRESGEKSVRAVAAGGDGTVKWVISELERIGHVDIPIGVIPFGTGNDMARILGWGATAPSPLIGGEDMGALKGLITDLVMGELLSLDVWRVETRCDEEKRHFDVAIKGEIVERADKAKVVVDHMINYCSFGQDARAVFGFERHRRTTQFMNKVQFALEGGKLTTFLPARQLKNIVLTVDDEDASAAVQSKQGLIFQNIPSYAAGSDFWGAQVPWTPGDAFSPQLVGDVLLEVHALDKLIDIGLSKATLGARAATDRLAQGRSFKLTFDPEMTDPMYFQVDGEPCRIVSPTSCEIREAFQVTMVSRNDAKAGLVRSLRKKKSDKASHNNSVLHSSFLLKARKRAKEDVWNARFVALVQRDEGRLITLEWYLGKKLRRKVKLVKDGKSLASWAKLDHAGKRPNSCFTVTVGRSTYHFAAKSEAERDQWLASLDNVGGAALRTKSM